MASIPETMRTISKDIQNVFEELMKLMLRKNLRSALNPLGNGNKLIYNNFTGKYERGLINSTQEDTINKYNYIMTPDSIGWSDDYYANFRVMAKFIKNNNPQKFPTGNAKMHNLLKSKAKITFSSEKNSGIAQYKNFIFLLGSKNIQNLISDKQEKYSFTFDIPYIDTFKYLENIGKTF